MTGALRRERWDAHPVLGLLLRLVILLAPVVAGVLGALAVASALPESEGRLGTLVWWGAVLGGSLAAMLITDRIARRLLPLAVLLELCLVFPDRAPSRMRAARTTSVRDLENRLARLRGQGEPMERHEAAETLVVLVGMLGLHDKRTRGHSERVRAFTDLLTDELDLSEDDRSRIRWAALVHDLGKLAVPGAILNGGRDLSEDDWSVLYRHPEEGERLVAGLLPWLGEWGAAVVEHHERWDGGGYPRGLAGEGISYAGRIVALADSFEVMTAARSYKAPMSAAEARRELARCAGTQFDPALVRAFLGISLGKLRWVMGPFTWMATVPFLPTGERAGVAVKAGAAAGAVAGLAAIGSLTAPQPSPPEDRVPQVAAAPTFPAPTPEEDPEGVGTDGSSSPDPAPGELPLEPEGTAPEPDPVAAAQPDPDPAPRPIPAAAPAPSKPSPTTRSTPRPRPSPTLVRSYLDLPASLTATAPAKTETLVVSDTATLEGPVTEAFRLDPGTPPRAELFLDLADSPGQSGRLQIDLQACTATCTSIATGEVGKSSPQESGLRSYSVVLTPGTSVDVAAGATLRLVLTENGGGESSVLLAAGGRSPSRLDLPATVMRSG